MAELIEAPTLVPVPGGYPIDYPLPREEKVSRRNMQLARRMLGPRAEVSQMRCPRDAKADAIIRQALLLRAEAIVMPMPSHRPPGKLHSRTLETVLGKRPCRVIIDSVAARPFTGRRVPA